jgi:gliding motility-associated-like protein
MKISLIVIFLLMVGWQGNILLFAQPIYDNCYYALELCPNTSFTVTNVGAGKVFGSNAEDDFTFCFTSNNSVWFKFTTNSLGGNAQIDFSSLVFESGLGQDTELQAVLYSTIQPCAGNTYAQVGNCVSSATGNFTLTAAGLNPTTTYYLVVSGDKTGAGITLAAECTFNLVLSGGAVDRIVPSIAMDVSNTSICENEEVTFVAHVFNCPDSATYSWSINGNLMAVTQDSIFQSSALNSGDVVTVSNSCFLLCPQEVTVASAPFIVNSVAVNAGEDVHILPGQTVQLNGTTNASNYSWSPGFLLTSTSILNPVAVPMTTTTYTFSGTENGCTDFDQVVVYVDNLLTIPSTFSPNNDGINDVWEIVGIESFPNNFVRVYDRWGQEVFQKISYSFSTAWAGKTQSGWELSSGVYFYTLELKDESQQIIKGTITLIR